LAVPCDYDAPRRVRVALDRLEAIDPVRVNAKLVATEIVSNAVRHSGCTPDHLLEVRAHRDADILKISVHDPGLTDQAPRVREDPDVGGLGLVIVDRLAHRWGIERPNGRLVWVELRAGS
jgi:anti-sigma regulatory factor (Ser/Thr protein kinase)